MSTQPTDAEIDEFLDSPGNINWVLADKRERFRLFARAVLAKWGTLAPVGVEPALHQYQASDGTWKDFDSERHRRDTVAAGYPVRTLYTVTKTGAGGAVPLTPEQRTAAFIRAEKKMQSDVNLTWRHALADEIEAAHGIKGGQHGTAGRNEHGDPA